MKENHETLVLVNAAAGSGRGSAEAVARALADNCIPARVLEIAPGALEEAIRTALDDGEGIVAVAGGDGTLSTAAALLAGSNTVLAPIPTGTLNHFARRLGLDDIETALHALRSGHTLRVPVGLAGTPAEVAAGRGHRFLNNASCGFYPHVIRHRERLRPWVGKWPAALVAGVRVLLGLRRLSLTLEVREATLPRRVVALWVGLGRDSFTLPDDDEPKPGASQLEIVLPRARSRRALVQKGARVLWRLLRGQRPDPADVEILHAPALTLEARHAIDVALDGEPLRLRPPLRFAIHSAALEVIAPVGG